MSKTNLEKENLVNFICGVLGVNPESIDITDIDVKKEDTDGVSKTEVKASLNIEDVQDKIKDAAEKVVDKINEGVEKYHLQEKGIDAVNTILGFCVDALSKAATAIDEKNKVLAEKKVEASENDCDEDCPCCDECCGVNGVKTTAQKIKETFRKQQQSEYKKKDLTEKMKKFYQAVIEYTEGFVTFSLNNGDYTPLTENVDDDDSGIQIVMDSKILQDLMTFCLAGAGFEENDREEAMKLFDEKEMAKHILEGANISSDKHGFDEVSVTDDKDKVVISLYF